MLWVAIMITINIGLSSSWSFIIIITTIYCYHPRHDCDNLWLIIILSSQRSHLHCNIINDTNIYWIANDDRLSVYSTVFGDNCLSSKMTRRAAFLLLSSWQNCTIPSRTITAIWCPSHSWSASPYNPSSSLFRFTIWINPNDTDANMDWPGCSVNLIFPSFIFHSSATLHTAFLFPFFFIHRQVIESLTLTLLHAFSTHPTLS